MNPKEKINSIMSEIGMTGVKAAEAMGITYGTFRKCNSDSSNRNTFNEKNYHDLINFIKEKYFNILKLHSTK